MKVHINLIRGGSSEHAEVELAAVPRIGDGYMDHRGLFLVDRVIWHPGVGEIPEVILTTGTVQ